MKNTKATSIVLVFLLLSVGFFAPKPAKALVVWDPGNFAGRIMEYVLQGIQEALEALTEMSAFELNYNDTLDRELVNGIKIAFVEYLNSNVSDIYSTGNNGNPYFVTDWADYLYKQPQEFARNYIENEYLVNKLSGGNCNSAGTNPYYDYLCDQGLKSIQVNVITTTLPEYMSAGKNPQDNIFADGDLRAFSAYISECGNNPYCTSESTKDLYNQIAQQEKEIAQNEVTDGGTLPQKNPDGTIAVPANVYEHSIQDAMSVGNETIVNAQTWQEITAAISSIAMDLMIKSLGSQFYSGNNVDHTHDYFFEQYHF